MADEKLSPNLFKRVTVDSSEKEKINTPALTFTQDAMRRLRQNKAATISMWIIIAIAVISIITILFHRQTLTNKIWRTRTCHPRLLTGGFLVSMAIKTGPIAMPAWARMFGSFSGRTIWVVTCYHGSSLGRGCHCLSRSSPPCLI